MKRYTLLIIFALAALTLSAQVTTGITIGGDVYGGGKQGAVNIGNTTTITYYTEAEAAEYNTAHASDAGFVAKKAGDVKTVAEKDNVTLTNATKDATSVIISDEAVVRTVFGGGMNGRCYGQTNVIVEGGEVGAAKWSGTIHGGVFGAGDGATAYVFGRENSVLVKGGKIWNNVYGGGNQADLMGCTKVTLQDGEYHGSVFGGARMADIYGYAYLNLDGKNGPTDHVMVIPAVYGGNDISGTIALSTNDNWPWIKKDGDQKVVMPFIPKMEEGNLKVIDNTWSAFIQSTSPTDVTNNNFFVGNLYGGGNGDYEYTKGGTSLTLISTPAEEASADFVAATYYTAEDQEVINGTKNVGDVKTPQVGTAAVAETTEVFDGLSKPELAKTYLNLQGGTYGYVYGGGNNATVTESTDIMVWNAHFDKNNNNTAIMASIPASRVNDMGVQKSMFTIDGDKATVGYQIDRIFGGNNKAAMAIQPNWYLAQGSFNNIYSGGNKGDMTNADGILISIGSRSVYANNVYGGCRMSDVHPKDGSGNDVTTIPEKEIRSLKVSYNQTGQFTGLEYSPYKFAKDYAARVYITEGHINNVYGGNDISGRVYMGTNVAIAGAISGNVYGGGNGSYAYTDNAELAKDSEYADLYYAGGNDASTSITALNDYRPHVENTLLHIWGNDGMANNQYTEANDQEPVIAADGSITAKGSAVQPVIVTGGVYCGGNSATIEGAAGKTPTATFNIGKNVIINAVFLGSNGENMVSDNILQTHASTIDGNKYSKFDLTDGSTFATYMKGCAVDIRPTIIYDWTDDEEPHTYIGSLFGGGNVGSVTYGKPITLDMPSGLKIFNHVVGGCNNANVEAGDNNASFEGGFITANSGADASSPKLTINMQSYLEPRRLNTVKKGVFLESAKLPWNVHEYFKTAAINDQNLPTGEHLDSFKALESANVYAGCYTSGIIQGNVEVNIDHDLISPDVFTMLEGNSDAAIALKTKGTETLTPAMALKQMGNYAMANTMLVYGGGYGEETTIKGDVHVNLSGNARVLSVLGGAEEGVVTGSTYVKAAAGMKDYSTENNGALPFNSVAIYGGAYAGPIEGHTELQLYGGTFLNAFGGSCNADILGYAATYIGNGQSTGYPFIKGFVFGGNDFGGYIKGYKDYTSAEGKAGYNSLAVRSPRYVEYNSGRIGDDNSGETSIYGGSYGSYDYSKYYWSTAVIEEFGEADYEPDPDDVATGDEFHFPLANEVVSNDGLASGGFITNTYVNIQSKGTDQTKDNVVRGIFGGGRGVMERTGIVDATQTYVYLHGATWAQRNANLSTDVYGGGYFSVVDNTRVDLETGCTGFAYGGSYGTTAQNLNNDELKGISYNSIRTEVNLYNGMDNSNMAIFGGGGYAGSTETYVNLYGGTARNVYGGSYNEGYCQTTHVDVPSSSTAVVNAIFGGGFGNNVALPCDEDVTNVTFSSSTAYVADAIYGGNNDKRAAHTTNVVLNAPLRASATGDYSSVFGAGNGECTVAGFTNITLNNGAQAGNVYGGGRDGKVFGYYQNFSGAPNYYGVKNAEGHYLNGHANWEYQNIGTEDTWEGTSMYSAEPLAAGTNLFGYYTRIGDAAPYNYVACASTATADGSSTYYKKVSSTAILVNQGATAQNVYGGGYGAKATVTGSTRAHVHGGAVTENLFGGGYSGNVEYQKPTETATDNTVSPSVTATLVEGSGDDFQTKQKGNIYTYVCAWGGSVNSVYGGGFNGQVGTDHEDLTAEARVEIGEKDVTNHYAGSPVVLRSVYGGGYRGAIYGTAKIQMSNGYVGYDYDTSITAKDGETEAQTEARRYVENLNISAEDDRKLLVESGNIFGGGYGEGATTDKTIVNMYGGTIRNSLYGGGEIASVGVAENIIMSNRAHIPDIVVAGRTEVNMYGGLVTNNVFGGGRGYAVDDDGNMATGEIGYSDGYTFGQTNVNIYRGTIGTSKSVADGNGNVFGGGNIGYVYGGADDISISKDGKTYRNSQKSTDNYYHKTSNESSAMTEDCRVVISPYLKVTSNEDVTINGNTYHKGEYVKTKDLNTLASDNSYWKNNLDNLGVNIGNAVFAGGNVSAGSDKVYANTKTIYGNATASVLDVLNKDFITLGDDGIGGLYGDGNLTFVDGYRELNITNYGTDYYNLNNSVTLDEYKKLSDRERAYFELLYQSKSQHTYKYYTCLETHTYTPAGEESIAYKKNQKVPESVWNTFTDEEKHKWSSSTSSKNYGAGDTVDESTWNLFDSVEQGNWEQKGFCTLYAGRMMNTIQRADFCGVFGSRVVLKGAQDRVPSVVDYTDYTINRVGEVSLNQACKSKMNPNTDDETRSNYFGIYNVVNFLGALTSDITWNTVRKTANATAGYKDAVTVDGVSKDYGTATYLDWKKGNLGNRKRNNGSSRNEVALASGVWLEVVKELATSDYIDPTDGLVYKKGDKVYGPITGIVELNLINVATGEGGGYVYAKNIHGDQSASGNNHVTLADANNQAQSYKLYTYTKLTEDPQGAHKMESSGNFVNSLKRIVDDCYPKSSAYVGASASTAHYWYIRGEFYVYDQYISAYTGSSQPYAKDINIPLTITPEARGRLSLATIEKNHYAYWTLSDDQLKTYKSSVEDDAIVVNGVTYHKNDPISDWEWSRLTDYEQTAFFTTSGVETYACTKAFTYNSKEYKVGDMLMPTEYTSLSDDVYICTNEYKQSNGSIVAVNSTLSASEYTALANSDDTKKFQENYLPLKGFFHLSNAISHDNGFLLTLDWDNPSIWNDYYKKATYEASTSKKPITKDEYDKLSNEEKKAYVTSPTFRCVTEGVYGQREYKATEIIDKVEYESQNELSGHAPDGQATFESAYAAKETQEINNKVYVKGACISATEYNSLTDKSNFAPAYICTETYQNPTSGEYYTYGSVFTTDDIANITTLTDYFKPAYTCTSAGKWGGKYFAQYNNYKALDICNLNKTERENFTYNYDALDLLSENFDVGVGSDYQISYYQGNRLVNGSTMIPENEQIPYTEETSIDYTAIYTGENMTDANKLAQAVTVTRGDQTVTTDKLQKNDRLTNLVYENGLLNEQFNYTPLVITGEKYRVNSDITDSEGNVQYAAGSYLTQAQYNSIPEDDKSKASNYDMTYYIVNENFRYGNTWYCVGNTISETVFEGLTTEQKSKVSQFKASALDDPDTGDRFYFCTRNYTSKTALATDGIKVNGGKVDGTSVSVGALITPEAYNHLPNEQTNFNIDGVIPTETTTLYVARQTDIDELSKDRIVTVTYWYEYIESDEQGSSYETIRERHIINVHIHFESGVPTIGKLLDPNMVLPGTAVALSQPSVSKGAYEILGGGWEIYSSDTDAEAHKNGEEYTNNNTKLYLYQNNYYVAYYAKTYLGKTFSNAVPVHVVNFHRMEDVMTSKHTNNDDPESPTQVNDYMYLNKAVENKYIPKVYINDHTCKDNDKTELEYMYDLYKATVDKPQEFDQMQGCQNIDVILQSDVNYPAGKQWTSVGDGTMCFRGNFHGDGHTIHGLDKSLFGTLCGNVYNTGVTGSFTSAGVVDNGDGRVENCWIATTGTPNTSVKAVFGNPTNDNQVVNCYYPETNAGYLTGPAIMKPVKSFLDGEVAYNLNGFYLKARHNIAKSVSGDFTNNFYKLTSGGTIERQQSAVIQGEENKPYDISYANADAYFTSADGSVKRGYVEDRYFNGDFIYAGGKIPRSTNIRTFTNGNYYPVFPDDYLFFGQHLTYGIVPGTTSDSHVDHPEAVNRVTDDTDESKNTKLLVTSNVEANRVYRAPAYYNSKTKSTAYFNKPAAFKDTYTLSDGNIYGMSATENVYKNLTAIDFTGYYYGSYAMGGEQTAFYPPLLDYDGISSFNTSGVTRNLLVYDDPSGDVTSYGVLNTALPEATLVINADGYNSVEIATDASSVKGHLVDKSGSTFIATRDHYLVDKEVFNCPISYKFSNTDSEKFYMWYQRQPENYVDASKGWEAISLPFTADLVATQSKGEITHFYSNGSTYTNGYDSGHEYWLREFKGIGTAPTNAAPNTYYAAFNYPDAVAGNETKTDYNVFLWDYYYSHDDNAANGIDKDNNTDDYQTYYKAERSYPNYPLYTAAKSYIVGFPGKRYYEFDMSGNFQPQNRSTIDKLDPQTISFVSKSGYVIAVSDDELATAKTDATAGGYIYVPNYSNDNLTANNAWMLNAAGSSFEKITADKAAVPFRPYFTAEPSGAKSVSQYDEIAITSVNFNKGIEDKLELSGELNIYAKKGVIVVESGLDHKVGITIFNSSGMTVTTFSIAPGEKVETNVPSNVIYIVNKKKLFVK